VVKLDDVRISKYLVRVARKVSRKFIIILQSNLLEL